MSGSGRSAWGFFTWIVVAATVATQSGCLSSTHVLPDGELARLASLPPSERGQRVRVIQGGAGAEEPPERAPRVGVSAAVIINPIPGPSFRHGYGYGYRASRPSVKSLAEDSKWILVLAAVVAVGAAATEGARFDGWASLHPMHPVHIWGADGQWSWVPLAQLDAGTAAWARKAFVRAEEGPWRELERAPLNRVGFTYTFLLGSGEVTAFDDVKRAGFLSHIQIGFHPTQAVGILFDTALGWRTNQDKSDIYQSRYALELQVLPLDLGILHGGGYGQVGAAYHFEDFPSQGVGYDRTRFLVGGGGLVQLELTTRLALTLRAGLSRIASENTGEITAGLSVY